MEVDSPSPPLRVALDLDLSHSTKIFLERIGFLHSSETATTSLIRDTVDAYQVHLPLIPLKDLTLFLSCIDPTHLPSDLPFPISQPTPSSQLRTNLIQTLSRSALSPSLTIEILSIYRPIATLIVGYWFEFLGLNVQGEWRIGEPGIEQAQGEREAVEKVWRAVTISFPLLKDEIIPYVTLSHTAQSHEALKN